MKVMVFDVGGTEIKYSVMDEGLNRTDAGSVPTPQDTQEHFLDTLYALYAPHRDEVSGIAMALPGFVDTYTGFVSNGGALLYNRKKDEVPAEVTELVEKRAAAKKAKDWATADAIRAQLTELGWAVKDTAQGPQLSKL